MKKTYIKPQTTSVHIEKEGHLMISSLEIIDNFPGGGLTENDIRSYDKFKGLYSDDDFKK